MNGVVDVVVEDAVRACVKQGVRGVRVLLCAHSLVGVRVVEEVGLGIVFARRVVGKNAFSTFRGRIIGAKRAHYGAARDAGTGTLERARSGAGSAGGSSIDKVLLLPCA